jgi:hypothetical protein
VAAEAAVGQPGFLHEIRDGEALDASLRILAAAMSGIRSCAAAFAAFDAPTSPPSDPHLTNKITAIILILG